MTSAPAKISAHSGLTTVSKSTPVDELLRIIDRDGGVIVEELFTKDQVDRLNKEIDPHLDALPMGSLKSEEDAQMFHGNRTKRLGNLITLSETFRNEFIADENILGWATAMLSPAYDSYWLSCAQVAEIHPGQPAQVLHRDSELYAAFIPLGPAAPMLQINAIIALNDFTDSNGATRVIPGSNQWDDYTDRGSPDATIPAVMSAGSALLTNGRVLHGGGANNAEAPRRGLLFAFNPGYLMPEEAFPFIVPMGIVQTLPPHVQNLLGFRSFHDDSHSAVSLWQVHNEELADHLGL